MYTCFPGGGTNVPLVDGELGAVMSSGVTSSMVHAWSRSTGRVEITIEFDRAVLSSPIQHFNLFFYNIPSMGIGLPNIKLFGGAATPLPYFLTGNQDISQDDDGRRNVTLSLINVSPLVKPLVRVYRVEFDFNDADIDWLILSEVILCNEPNGGMSRN